MPEMPVVLSSVVAVVALIVAVLSTIQRRKLAAELASVRKDSAQELSKQKASLGLFDQGADEGKKAIAILAEVQAALTARDAELDALTAELGAARTAEAKARTKSAEETRARAAAEANAAQEIEDLRRASEAAQGEARAVSKVLVDEARQRKEVELQLDRELAKAQSQAAGAAQNAGLQGQIRALEAAAAAPQKEFAAVRKEADEARAAVKGAPAAEVAARTEADEARARVKALEEESARAAAAPAPAAPGGGESAPAGEGGGVALAIDSDAALNRGQKETLRMMYDRFTSKAAKR